jgi:ribonuclease-3
LSSRTKEIDLWAEEVFSRPFDNRDLLVEALTHTSYANEAQGRVRTNQRLEFLGDSVLSLSVSSRLFQQFPDRPEGDLTRLRAALVSEPALARAAGIIGLGTRLRLGRGEEASGGRERDSVLADAFEAVVGALYLDQGLDVAAQWVLDRLGPELLALDRDSVDHKTRLQEILQATTGQAARYQLLAEDGPDHRKVFTVAALSGERELGRGSGRSKKEAEQEAARQALGTLERGGLN